jgi:phosphate-selective porin OprO/OprP
VDGGHDGGSRAKNDDSRPQDNKEQVEKIVKDYLKAQEDKKKKEQDEKKKESKEKGHEVGSDLNTRAFWSGQGLTFETPHKDFRVHVGGRFSVDGAWFGANRELEFGRGGVGRLEDGADFRRGRVRVEGTMYENINWVSEFAFDAAQEGQALHPSFIDVYGEITQLPVVGNFRAGHFREPFSMEALSSGNGLPLLERSSAFEAFVPFRNIGVMIFDTVLEERMTWATGVFRTNSRNSGNPFDVGEGEYSSTSRVTFLPWYEQDGLCLLHLGAAYSHRSFLLDPGQDRVRFRAFPGIRTGRYIFADSGAFPADTVHLVGAEVAVNFGSFYIQGEYYHAWVQDAFIGGLETNPRFHGWYVQAGYFLTGEHRAYSTLTGTLERPRPHENFFFVRRGDGDRWQGLCKGLGAWEVAARYSTVDVNDPEDGIQAQILQDMTFGLTWYLNPNTRIQWNYILAHRNFPAQDNRGLAHIFGTRFHMDF